MDDRAKDKSRDAVEERSNDALRRPARPDPDPADDFCRALTSPLRSAREEDPYEEMTERYS